MPVPTARINDALAFAEVQLSNSIERLKSLIAIPSISTDPRFSADVQKAAEWLATELAAEGYAATVHATPGHPMVVAHDHSANGPHVLFYGHYDVQPVDPVELWQTDPFTATLLPASNGETHIVGRGSSDDKGQLLTFIEACRAWRGAGGLPVKVTILLEGEEESGSGNLSPFLEAMKSELRADVALVCDTDMWDDTTPAITMALRGLVAEEIEITCANKDLHSGLFGNAARNPIQVLGEIIASLRTPDGGVALSGFYDGVPELAADVAENWRRLGFDEAAFLASVGLRIPAGEKGRSVLEQVWARPTCEINGIVGGYTGEGFKTVIPGVASAKVSFRLVGHQDPIRIRDAFRAHVRERIPPDCSVSFKNHAANPAIAIPPGGVFLSKALAALASEWGKEAAMAASGGSIPVVGEFKRKLQMDTLLIGFAHADDRIHSPNEKYNLTSFRKGIRSWVRILGAFAE